ncbi:hypothetical protein E2562_015310 [Oryza meyeriana var. granulata]|uniref:Branched-chain-amino-acid aminotransferase n=1 Tax=Oryza meyeriana var. granulata TaxID=110450 RepID=A0A6G1DJJ6_9ORYZ|nr:hypothetical protein E2562_015310 [Oryza meyeriana var. granulata]
MVRVPNPGRTPHRSLCMAASSASSAKRALLPWARNAHHALARALQGSGAGGSLHGAPLSTAAGGGRWSLLQCRRRSSLPQRDAADRSEPSDEDTGGDIDWDNLGFGLTPTDYMYVMRCSLEDVVFSRGELSRYGNIELSPSSGVINYGQGLFEGLKAYRTANRQGYMLFRPEENARRMQHGAERMCMPSPSVEQFVHAVKQTVLANRRWVPPQGKGALYIRPLLIGSGPILGLAPAPEYTFLVYASPVGTYFKEGLAPINLVVQDAFHRAMPGGTGGVKTIANYAPVLKAQMDAKSKGFTDVLYLDAVHKRYLEEASSCNLFIVKDGVVATPATVGTILPGITRKSVIELARDRGYQVEERLVSIDDLMGADEVFCTGTAVVVAPVSTVTYQGQRYEFKTGQDTLSQTLHMALTSIQKGLAEDKKGWTVAID